MDSDRYCGACIIWRKKIPEFMKGLGKGMREFNDAKNNVKQEFENGLNESQKPAPTSAAKD